MRRRRALLWIERVLTVTGVLCLGYYAYSTVEARQFQRAQVAALEKALAGAVPPARPVAPDAPAADAAPSAAVAGDAVEATAAPAPRHAAASRDATPSRAAARSGRTAAEAELSAIALLDIPRLSLSAPVLPGDDDATLALGIGHLPDTPMPWEGGNSALAAHRDGLFRPLRHIRVGDEVRVRSSHGEFLYRVRETKIVTPDDLSVLAPSSSDTLTLITCYPFNFVGNAPKRFIVHADRVSTGTH